MRTYYWQALIAGLGIAQVGYAQTAPGEPAPVQQPPPPPVGQQQNVYVQPPPAQPAYAPPPPAYPPAQPVQPVVQAPPAFSRFSLLYSPEVLFADPPLGRAINQAAQGGGIHNLGIEISQQTGWAARYHVQLDYTYGYGYSGVRLEPLGFGWAFPLIRTAATSLELEPLVSVADGLLLFSNDARNNGNATFLLSSGAEVQLNLVVSNFYVYASPVGIELRWLEALSGYNSTTYTGADWLWRFRIGAGFQY
jgi:hypothetical protein